MKLIKEWLNEIEDEGVRRRALANHETHQDRAGIESVSPVSTPHEAICAAFDWDEAPEGHNYWQEVAEDILADDERDLREADKDELTKHEADPIKVILVTNLEAMETIFVDIKKVMHYSKSQGEWWYSDRGEEHIENWDGPFPTRLEALADAVGPYMEDSE